MSSKNSTKIVCASIIVVGGILAYMYYFDGKKPVHPVHPVNPVFPPIIVPVHPVNPVNPVFPPIHTAPVGHAGLEGFAYGDVRNSYVHGGDVDMNIPGVTGFANINGILTNFTGKSGEVMNVGWSQTNEADMGQRDPRAIEGYVMNEHQYGAGTPNYRALAGYY